MKKILSIFGLSALMLFVMGCDKIDINNTHKPYTPSGGSKTVLIKDFTGVRCVNCPEAATTAHELQHQLGEDRIFIMGVHAGYQATPVGSFPDFTTEEGTAWYNDNASNPLFSVDRVALTDGNTLNVGQLDASVADALTESQTFELSMVNTFDASTRQLKVKSDAVATADFEGQLYLTVCLVEDSIIGRQVVPGGIDTAYVFRNVFRGTLNGADGELISNGQVFVNDEFSKNYTTELNPLYNADQCYIMTYVYDKADGKILQTAMEKIK